MKLSIARAALVFAVLLVVGPLAVGSIADATTVTSGATSAPKYCAILLGKQIDRAQPSPVLAESCSEKSPADAAAGLPAVAAREKLMTWYSDARWKGDHADIFGNDGTCDTAGYSFTPSNWWQTHMSSIKGYKQCTAARLTNRALTQAKDYNLPATFGADTFNDNVGRVSVYQR